MKKYIYTALAGTCLFGTLNSCVQWGIGKRIEDSLNTYHSVDTRIPVDGRVYRLEKDGKTTWYMQAPGITCHAKHYLVTPPDLTGAYGKETFISGVKYTGRDYWVQVHPVEPGMDWDCRDNAPTLDSVWAVDRYVDGLPKGAKLWSDTETLGTEDDFPAPKPLPDKPDGQADGFRQLPGRILGAPFTYAIDPALTFVSSIPVGVFHLFGGLLAVDWLQNQQMQPPPASAQVSAVRRGTGYTYMVNWGYSVYNIYPAADLPRRVPTSKPLTVSIFVRPNDAPPTEAEKQSILTDLRSQGYREIDMTVITQK